MTASPQIARPNRSERGHTGRLRRCQRGHAPAPGRLERGQASVELMAALPFVLLVGALVWQLALTGHAAWMSAQAARAAARAEVVGRDGRAAARSALPTYLERGMSVRSDRTGRVRVDLRVPLLLRSWSAPTRIGATAYLGAPP